MFDSYYKDYKSVLPQSEISNFVQQMHNLNGSELCLTAIMSLIVGC